jgi:hypothetical protein
MDIQFTPVLRVIPVDENAAVVMFDFASAHDEQRAPKVLRLPRKFAELSTEVSDFVASPEEPGKFKGSIKLMIKQLIKDTKEDPLELLLATPCLRFHAKGNKTLPSGQAITNAVRISVADALSSALLHFYDREAQIDLQRRSPPPDLAPSPAPIAIAPHPARGGLISSLPLPLFGAPAKNNAMALASPRYRKPMIVAAALVLVVGFLAWMGGPFKRSDPIKEAVAQTMAQNPQSVLSQVQLTQETLKQMGLDPGKSSDTGCFSQK